jgi:hypothetical protein
MKKIVFSKGNTGLIGIPGPNGKSLVFQMNDNYVIFSFMYSQVHRVQLGHQGMFKLH